MPSESIKVALEVISEQEGSVLGRITMSPFENLSFGLSYRIDSLIGYGTPTSVSWLWWLMRENPPPLAQLIPGMHARLKLINKPVALVGGFDLQVHYRRIKKGKHTVWYIVPIYGVAEVSIKGKCSSYAGINYAGPFMGGELKFGKVTFMVDWFLIAAWRPDLRSQLLDVGIKWFPAPGVSLKLGLLNLLEGKNYWGGTLEIVYGIYRGIQR